MITFRKIGIEGARLGNQLSQYAALVGVAEKHGYEIAIPYENKSKFGGLVDLYTGHWISVNFRLSEAFNLSAKQLTEEMNKSIIYSFEEDISKSNYNPLFLDSIKDNTDIHGFFQSEKYWLHCEDKIRKEFEFIPDIKQVSVNKLNEIRKTFPTLISVHVRHGDYLGNPRYNVLSSEYYQNAMNILVESMEEEFAFVIFSDDIPWCKTIFGDGENVFYMEKNKDLYDLCMMTLCDHNIIANSTFSWWGAWLNNNKNKKVISPFHWFKGELEYLNTKEMHCKNWTII
jgi:hypothetical protein